MNNLPSFLPDWIESAVDYNQPYSSDYQKMALAISLARQNVEHGTGGPFGAVVFNVLDNTMVGVGVNRVVPLNNSVLHAEVVAIMHAESVIGSFTLKKNLTASYELFTSCAPCAMCIGAIFWSGVERLVCAAHRDDASVIGFDEGPVFDQSYEYLRSRGMVIVHEFMRSEAVDVFGYYQTQNGTIYNG